MKHAFLVTIAVIAMASVPIASANLRRVQVKKGDTVSKDLGLAVVISRDEHFPDVPIVTVTTRADGPLATLFGSGLRVAEERHRRVTSLVLDTPVEFTQPLRTEGLRLTFRLHESMLRSATLYLRCGTPYSEVMYEIRLDDYMKRAGE